MIQVPCISHPRCPQLPSGKRLHSELENHHFQWVNQRTQWPCSTAFPMFTRAPPVIIQILEIFQPKQTIQLWAPITSWKITAPWPLRPLQSPPRRPSRPSWGALRRKTASQQIPTQKANFFKYLRSAGFRSRRLLKQFVNRFLRWGDNML